MQVVVIAYFYLSVIHVNKIIEITDRTHRSMPRLNTNVK